MTPPAAPRRRLRLALALLAACWPAATGCSVIAIRPPRLEPPDDVFRCGHGYLWPVLDVAFGLLGLGTAIPLMSDTESPEDASGVSADSKASLASLTASSALLLGSAFYGFYFAKRCKILSESLAAARAEAAAKGGIELQRPRPRAP